MVGWRRITPRLAEIRHIAREVLLAAAIQTASSLPAGSWPAGDFFLS
jgi:hypothetical protein